MPSRQRGAIITAMAGSNDDTQRRPAPAPTPPPASVAPPQNSTAAAERLSVIWLRDTKDKARPP